MDDLRQRLSKLQRPKLQLQEAASGFFQAMSAWPRNKERNKTFFVLQTGNTLNSHENFIQHLNKQVRLQQVSTVDECDVILVFCPVVSRAGTDIEAALKKLNHESETKPAVLVVLHHTFDPDCVVPDSSRAVHRQNTITVDSLFHEDQGLLRCYKNDESLSTVLDYINPQDKKKQLEEKESVPAQTKVQIEECSNTDVEITKNTQQGHPDQMTNKTLETVDDGTMEKTRKEEENEIVQDKRDQPLNSDYPHIQMEQSLVEKMEKRHEEWHAEMNMEKKQLQEFKKCVEINKKILSEKDAELLETNKALKCAVKQIEETKTQLRRVEEELKTTDRKLKQKQTQLTDKERELEDMIQEQETSKNTIMELEKQILVKDRQIKEHETTFQQVTTVLDDSLKKQQCMESKNTRLENRLSDTHQELETCKTKLVAMEQELQRRITIQEQQEKQRNKQLEEKERLLTERDTQLQEKNKCLKDITQALQMKNKTLDKKDTLLRDVNEELRKTKMTLEENQSQLREKERQLDSVMKELDTSKTKLKEGDKELQDKDRYLNGSTDELKMKNKTMEEKDTHLPEVKEELEKTSGTLEQTDKRVTQEKEEDGEGAVMGIITCQTQSQNKSQNKDQQANEEEEENKENSIQVTGALNKDAITESQNTSKETQERKGSQHEEDEEEEEEEEANDTGEPQQEVKETEKNNEHQNDEDTETKEKNSDRDQSSENNKNSSCEGNTFLIKTTGRQTNATENNRAYKCNLSDSQTQDKDGLQLDNPLNPQRAEEQDTNTSDVKDESEKQTMEGQDSKSKENECVLKLESSKVNSESQEEEQEETEPEPLGDDTDRATDSSGNETA